LAFSVRDCCAAVLSAFCPPKQLELVKETTPHQIHTSL
jgi:hypothetical protein